LALVGSDTLLGREVKEVLDRSSRAVSIDNFAANGEGSFSEEAGESVYRHPLSAETLASTDFVIVAGTQAGAQKAYDLSKAEAIPRNLIDATGLLDHQPEARIWSPMIESATESSAAGWLTVVAHPVSAAIALLLTKLSKLQPVESAVFHVFEPASERGGQGIAELQQQTASLLAFRNLEKKTFDAQISFNLLPAYGEDAPVKLSTVEQQIEMDLATLLARSGSSGARIAMPSLRVIQAPVFHGYSISAWIELSSNVDSAAVAQSLASAEIEIRSGSEEAPTNVGVAGQSGLIAGDIRIDRNNPRAVWLWMVIDNLRARADNVRDLLFESYE
jgi:aspartate-semialdehyde dehydrogenase